MADNLHEQPSDNEVLTPGHLFDELIEIAYVNNSFRQNKQNFMHIVTDTSDTPSLDTLRAGDETDESVVARLIDRDMGEIDWPEPIHGTTFELQARRVFECIVDERNNKSIKQHLFLTYTMTVATKNIPLPAHIATKAYEISDEAEAVENAGNSQLDHVKAISIDSKDFTLSACEATVFYDSNDDAVAVFHTCQDPKCQFADADDTQRQVAIQPDSKGIMKIYEDLAEANGDNAPAVKDVETQGTEDDILSQFDWDGLANDMKDEQTKYDLKLAFEVLESLKKAFRDELGMNIRPTFPRHQD